MLKDTLTLVQASQLLQRHPNTLRYWDNKGILKALRNGKRGDRVYRQQDITDFLKKGEKNYASSFAIGIHFSLDEIYKSSVKFLLPQNREKLFPLIVDEARKLIHAEHGTILLEEHGKLKRMYSTSGAIASSNIRPDGRTYKAFKEKEPFVATIHNISDIHPHQYKLGVRSIIFVPLAFEGKSIGVLNLFSRKEKTFTEKDLLTLKLFGSLSSLAIRNMLLLAEKTKALRTRDIFISLASHEIKTPLSVVMLYSQLIHKTILQNKLPKLQWSELLIRESKRIGNLMNEFLQVDQIKQGDLHFHMEVCNLSDIIERAKDTFIKTHPKRVLRIQNRIKGKQKIPADCDKILQVILNILNNAAKFSPSSSPIIIKLSTKEKYVIIGILDQGIGIDPDVLPHIFDLFYKGTEGKQGMGLGLYLSQMIIQKHKGMIKVVSQKNSGTAVYIQLPLHD